MKRFFIVLFVILGCSIQRRTEQKYTGEIYRLCINTFITDRRVPIVVNNNVVNQYLPEKSQEIKEFFLDYRRNKEKKFVQIMTDSTWLPFIALYEKMNHKREYKISSLVPDSIQVSTIIYFLSLDSLQKKEREQWEIKHTVPDTRFVSDIGWVQGRLSFSPVVIHEQKAFVVASIFYGMNDGSVFFFFLEKKGKDWRIVQKIRTAVS